MAIENALDYEGLKYYDGKSKEHISDSITESNAFDIASGDSIFLNNNNVDSALIDFKGYGRSEQANYSGKNLFGGLEFANALVNSGATATIDTTNKKVTLTASTDTASKVFYDTFNENTQYTFFLKGIGNTSGSGHITNLRVCYTDDTNVLLNFANDGSQTLFVTDSSKSVKSLVGVNNVGIATFEYEYFGIQEGICTLEDFEPYVGVHSSPSPDYPQDIKSVGDMGWFDGELLQGYRAKGTLTSVTNHVCSKNFVPCKEGDNIKLAYEENVSQLAIFFYDENMVYISSSYNTNQSEYEVIAPTNACYFDWFINKGSITPSNTKKIVVTINGTYAIKMKSTGKNLLSSDNIITYINANVNNGVVTQSSADTATSVVFKLQTTKNDSYNGEISSNLTVTSTGRYSKKFTKTKDFNGFRFGLNGTDTDTLVKFGVEHLIDDKEYVLSFEVTNITQGSISWKNMQLEIGSEATDYESYKENIEYIPINEPLRSINNVRDEIVCVDNVYGVLRKSGCTHVTSVASKYNTTATNYFYYIETISNLNLKTIVQCNNLIKNNYSQVNGKAIRNVGLSIYRGKLGINVGYYLSANNIDTMNTWLAENPTYMYYQLTETVFEPFENQTIFNNILAYNPTLISATDDMEMEIKYFTNSVDGQLAYEAINKVKNDLNEEILSLDGDITTINDNITRIDEDITTLDKKVVLNNTELNDTINSMNLSDKSEGNSILLTNSIDSEVIDFKAYGRSEQVNYTGKHLLKSTLTTTTSNGVTCTDNGDGTYALNGTPSEDTIFNVYADTDLINLLNNYNGQTLNIIGGTSSSIAVCIYIKSESTEFENTSLDRNISRTFTVPTDTVTSASIQIRLKVNTPLSNNVVKPMITTDLTAKYEDYEPYVGGIPSPNPDYPQDIKSVGDMGWFDGELLQGYHSSSSGTYTNSIGYVCSKNMMPCKNGDTIKLIYEETANGLSFVYFDENGTFISKESVNYVSELIGTIPTDARFFHININQSSITPSTAKKIVVIINDTYAVKVKSTGKNLLPSFRSRTASSLTFASNEKGAVAITGTSTSTASPGEIVKLKAGDYILSGASDIANITTSINYLRVIVNGKYYMDKGDGVAFSLEEETEVIVQIVVGNGVTINTTYYPMIRRAEIADSTFEPYKEHVEWIPLSKPLRSIGDVKDEIVYQDGVYGVLRNYTDDTYDGSDDESLGANSTIAWILNSRYNVTEDRDKALCTHYTNNPNVSVYNNASAGSNLSNGEFALGTSTIATARFYFKNDSITSLDLWKTWLQANPIRMTYRLANPIFEPFEDQSPFYNIKTYNNVTHIFITDDAETNVTYYRNSTDGQAVYDLISKATSTDGQAVYDLISKATNLLDEDITDLNEKVESYNEEVNDRIDDMKVNDESSGSPILLTDSADGNLINFECTGGSSQKSYSGKNLLENDATSQTVGGLTFTVNDDGSIKVSGTVTGANNLQIKTLTLAAGTYVLSGMENVSGSGDMVMRVYDVTNSKIIADLSKGSTSIIFTLSSETTLSIYINFNTVGITYSGTIYPMISVEGGNYEPYTGVQPSPNPSYPQLIKSKGDCGWNDGEYLQGRYDGTGTFISSSNYICNKNLIPCNEGDVVKFAYETTLGQIIIGFYDKDKNFISSSYNLSQSEYGVTAPTNAAYSYWNANLSGITPSNAKKIVVTINGTYTVKLTSIGKNQFDESQLLLASGWTYSDGVYSGSIWELYKVFKNGFDLPKFLTNTQYTISYYAKTDTVGNNSRLRIYYTDGTVGELGLGSSTTEYQYVKLITLSGKTIQRIGYTYGSDATIYIKNFQIEVGSTATEYKKFEEHTEWIPLAEPLRGIGDSADTIKATDDLYRGHRKFKEVVLDGSADWVLSTTFVGAVYVKTLPYGLKPFGLGLCDKFTYVSSDYAYNKGKFMIDSNSIRFWIQDTAFESIDEVRSWFNENPVTVLYEIAEEEIEELDQTPFYNLKTFEGVTYISASDDMDMVVEYYRNSNTGQAMADLDVKVNNHILNLDFTPTVNDNGKILGIVDGKISLITITNGNEVNY